MYTNRTSIADLSVLYAQYDLAVAEYTAAAICRSGCAFCCTEAGRIDATTLEGMVIIRWIANQPRARRRSIEKALAGNRRSQMRGQAARCPFLQANRTCMIYDLRPFSCRRLYSTAPCEGRGPTLHRAADRLARETVVALQRIDDKGYSGHISFILELLAIDDFRSFYIAGGFDPQRIMTFARPRGLFINRMAAAPAGHLNE